MTTNTKTKKRLSRLALIIIGFVFAFAYDLIGSTFLGFAKLTATELLIITFIGAWCGETATETA
jgi:hypothetical protein